MRAAVSASSTLKGLQASNETQIFVMGFLFLLYWAAPITSALTAFVQKDMIAIPRGTLSQKHYSRNVLAVMKLITKMYKPLCIAGSALIPRDAKRFWKTEGHFLHAYANPSERRTADQTWTVLCRDVNSGAWPRAARALAHYIHDNRVLSIHEMLEELRMHDLELFKAKRQHYMSIRFLRSLIYVTGKPHADTSDDWSVLSTMSSTLAEHLRQDGIKSYQDALAATGMLSSVFGKVYSLLDLVCYVCLRH